MSRSALRPPTRVGFVGLGQMGRPMAHNLLREGFGTVVFDASPQALRAFVDTHPGATAAPGLRRLAEQCEAVITMLPDGEVVREVAIDGEDNLAAGLRPGAILIDMSSSSPVGTRQLGERLAARGIALVDAPVSGGVQRALDGSLAIMAGGEAAALARCEPVLAAMGRHLFRTGGLGTGHAMKALNNFVSAAGFAAAAEAVLAGTRFGLAPETVVAVLNASTGRNNSTENKFPQQVLTRRFAAGFGLGLMVKDLRTAVEVAHATGVPAAMAEATLRQWAASLELLGAQADHTEMFRYVERLAGDAPTRDRAGH